MTKNEKENTPEKLKPLYPQGPCNRTDPIVRHDSEYSAGIVAKIYEPQYEEPGVNTNPSQTYDTLAVDAIKVPVIKLNNTVLSAQQISYFKLSCTDLVPTLRLHVTDVNNTIQFKDVPGFDNVITVVMIIPVEGVYKKISLDFYIINCKFYDNYNVYNATFKCMPLEKTHLEQIKFNIPNGCQEKWCKLPGNDKPTTYELLHHIAKECGLGFAATQQTKEINDRNYRFAYSQKLIDVMKQHTEFGGLDENSIFDSWIDVWGNIVLVNVAWLFNENVQPDELATVISWGTRQTNTMDAADSYHAGGLVNRMISNMKFDQFHNLMIEHYAPITDTGTLFYKGSNNTYNMMFHKGNGGSNNISTFEIIQKESSLDGESGNYDFYKTEFIGFEFAENTPICKQKRLHDKYFEKFRARKLKVTLKQPNFMLERGMLTGVSIFEYDPLKKRLMLQNLGNFTGEENSDKELPEAQTAIKEGVLDYSTPLFNVALSGIYYIDGVEFEYNDNVENIMQTLYLIKKGDLTNWVNRSSKMKFPSTNS